ncbi:uncharacterized protein LOC111709340 [Eurytemora carolleeae]|uniref:uncharacterized protein LOC111709340 n=1 Tax=Eurytemora carolleeae TaxID=1294199 RepID=UPI000C761577|nr:uncharacterized protein LOC111709340 [Eurytemora carolleeae]|eukprot:XP_023338751.1 uncharacterized protein LOC111709340 [Eurytemora affinis]
MEADPIDLQIVCGEFSLELAPETYSKENERVLQIEKITNHPKYLLGYPALGFDIAVYHVKNPQELRALNSDNVDPIANKTIYPACLPKLSFSQYNNAYPGDFYAWKDPEPTFKAPVEILRTYVRDNLLPREDKLNKVECGDPGWMNSNTYYPPGTICFKSIVQDSCVEFGNSGSPVALRAPWELSGKQNISRFHWAGTLSISKGCDQTFVSLVNSNSRKTSVPKLQIRSENPAVFTDARCYLDWIAEQYNHKPPVGYTRPKQCEIAVGDRLDKDNEMCRTNRNTTCDLTNTKCNLEAFEGYAYNIYRCNDTNGNMVNCANNCKGVDPNAVVVGGIAVGVTSAVGAAIANGIGTGVFGVGLPFLGGMAMMGMMRNERCLRSQCRPLNSPRCCNRLQNGSCPRRC